MPSVLPFVALCLGGRQRQNVTTKAQRHQGYIGAGFVHGCGESGNGEGTPLHPVPLKFCEAFVFFVLFVVRPGCIFTTKDTLAAVTPMASVRSQSAVGPAEVGHVTGQAKGTKIQG